MLDKNLNSSMPIKEDYHRMLHYINISLIINMSSKFETNE